MNTLKDDQLLTIVKNIVEQNGCRLVDIDFENHILSLFLTNAPYVVKLQQMIE